MSEQGNNTHIRSYLIAECGSVNTTVSLFDVADGAYHLVGRSSAPTTAHAPWLDLQAGVQQAIAKLTKMTGRVLLTDRGDLIRPVQLNGTGVDCFTFTISATEPLTAMLVALLDDVSLASARRALQSIYALELDHISLADGRNQQEQITSLLEKQPDIVLIAGGTEGGADERLIHLIETVEIGAGLQLTAERPQIVFAGNSHLRQRVSTLLTSTAAVHVADNVRPALDKENLLDAMRVLGELYDELKLGVLPGVHDLLAWSDYPPVLSARAFGGIIEFLAALRKGRVLGLDLGTNSVTFVSADPQQVRLMVRSDLGMGPPLMALAEQQDLDNILAWLPVELDRGVVLDYLYNKALAPQTVPMSVEELYLEQAIARVLMHRVVRDAAADWGWTSITSALLPPFQMLVIRGRTLTHAPRPGQVMAMVLDALQPTGVFSVAIDRYGILPALGAMAPYEPLLPVQILESGALVKLGWAAVPVGQPPAGQRAMMVKMDASHTGSLQMEVEPQALVMLPLSPGDKAQVTLQPQRGVDVGAGTGRKRTLTIEGGAMGLVIDARGRPLPRERPGSKLSRPKLIQSWLQDMGA